MNDCCCLFPVFGCRNYLIAFFVKPSNQQIIVFQRYTVNVFDANFQY